VTKVKNNYIVGLEFFGLHTRASPQVELVEKWAAPSLQSELPGSNMTVHEFSLNEGGVSSKSLFHYQVD